MARKPVNAAYLTKAPAEVHVGLAEFIEKTTGHTVPVGDVALVQRLYPLFRKSPAVVKAKEAEAARREQEKANKDAARKRKAKERLAALEIQRQKLLADLGIEPTAHELVLGADETEPAVPLAVVPDSEPEGVDEFEAEDGFEESTGEVELSAPDPVVEPDDEWSDTEEDW